MVTQTEILEDLKRTDLFAGLSLEGLEDAASRVRRRSSQAGETIVHRGDPGASIFLVLRGSAAVVLINEEGWEYTIATLGAGEAFGEMALLTGEPRSADVKAVSNLALIEIHQAQFQEMVGVLPELNRRLLRLLAQRLGKTTVQQQEEHWESREVIARLISYQQPPLFDHFPGTTRWAVGVNDAVRRIAAGGHNALVLGEPGTGKELVAKLVHYQDGGEHRPLFMLDCANPPPVLRATPRNESGEPPETITEFAQEAALFGHRAQSTVFAAGTRRGYLELADGGTLVLKNVEYLGARVQALLLDHLRTGSFKRMGESEARSSRVRVMACSSQNLERSTERNGLSPELLSCLSAEVVHLKPLRQRKQDIPVLAELFLAHFARQAHRSAHGFSKEAIYALVDHEWPFNIDGLRHVIERAVALCSGDEVTDEHVLLDIAPFEAKGAINLLRANWVRNAISGRALRAVLRFATVPVFIALMLCTLLGAQKVAGLSNLVIWTIGWPLLLVVSVLSARVWCGYFCPLSTISHAIGRVTERVSKAPRWIRHHGVWLGILGVVLIVWVEQATRMFDHPRTTGIFLLAILAAAVVCALLFGKRVWCRHLCPLGQLVSQYATLSPTQLRSNSNVCLAQCQTHDCVKDNNCPMNVHPSASAAAYDCILCFSCVRACQHNAVRVELRAPWRRIFDSQKWELPRAILPVVLVATVLALKLSTWLPTGPASNPHAADAYPGLTASAILLFLVVTTGYTGLAAWVSRGVGPNGRMNVFGQVAQVYIPIALAGYFNLHFREFVEHGEQILPAALDLLRLDHYVQPSWVTPNLGTLRALIPLITAFAAITALIVLTKVGEKCALSRASLRAHQLILTSTAILLIRLL